MIHLRLIRTRAGGPVLIDHDFHKSQGQSSDLAQVQWELRMAENAWAGLRIGAAVLALAASTWPCRGADVDVWSKPRIDFAHRFTIHYEFYPPESLRAHEQGRCIVSVFVDKTGYVRAAQLRMSTGFPRLDAACLISVSGQRMTPATLNGKAVGGWASIPIVWGSAGASKPFVEDSAPKIPDDYELQVGPAFYPASARGQKEEGVCLVYALVGADGAVVDARVLKSAGASALDRACIDAAVLTDFIPAKKDGVAVRAGAFLAIFWVLQ
jgi:TonB family protein